MAAIDSAMFIVRQMLRLPHLMPFCVQTQVLVLESLMTVVAIFKALRCATVVTSFAVCIITTIFVIVAITSSATSVTMPPVAVVVVFQTDNVLQSASRRCCRWASSKRDTGCVCKKV